MSPRKLYKGMLCIEDGCNLEARKNDRCSTHNKYYRRLNPLPGRPTCLVESCTTPWEVKSLCYAHRTRQRAYDLPLAEFLILMAVKWCQVCEQVEPAHIDHDHDTGEVRGMLCSNCNTAMGKLREDTQIMKNMIAYLERG